VNRWLTEVGQEDLPRLGTGTSRAGSVIRIHDAHPGVLPESDIQAGVRLIHAAIWRIRRAGLDY
jgi:hypothetical protein